MLKLRTDERGEASFDLLPPAADRSEEPERVPLVVTVTDSAGQKETKRGTIVVAARPLKVELIPEGGTLVAGVPNTIYVLVSTPDGRPARARVIVSGRAQELTTDPLGFACFEATPTPGDVVYRVRANGKDGGTSRDFRLACGQVENNFLLRTDRAVYNGGDTVHLTAIGGSDPILLDIIKDGKTLLTDALSMQAGRGETAFDLPADVFGTLELYAYRMAGTHPPVRQSRVLFVRPPTRLKIQTTLDRAEYRPGARSRLSFALTGAGGEPISGALSLAAVDEAVFALVDQTSAMDPVGSTIEPDLLQAVLAANRWSPTTTDKGRQPFDRALFAKAANPQHDTVHSLFGSTYPENSRHTATRRGTGLHVVKTVWIVAGVAGLAAAFILAAIALYRLGRRVDLLVGLAISCCALCCCLGTGSRGDLFFGVGARREDFEAIAALSGGRQIELAATEKLPLSAPRDAGMQRAPRVREWFPETLLWRPELITDDAGRASLDLDLADSITTWRLSVGAVTTDGRLGAAQSGIKVFQPFFVELNLPVALTRNDEVSVPVVVYNYLDRAQDVELKLEDAAWFRLLGEPVQRIRLERGAVRPVFYRLRVLKAGRHELQVTARASGVADAVKRPIDVLPDGHRVETVHNGVLDRATEIQLNLTPDAIDGSSRLLVKIAPSTFSQVVEGLDGILRLPYGCFEQTSSTTYPNVLALDYLRRTKKSAPVIEAKARHYIHLGYQRLVGFEVAGGGFDWFGRPPANRTLTAYGLMEFEDMARVHDVDSALIARTRKWLLDQRRPDGSWDGEGHMVHELAHGLGGDAQARLRTTAYIAWAVGRNAAPGQADATRSFLLAHRPEPIRDPYTLALVANALLAIDTNGRDAAPYLLHLATLRKTSADGKLVWWSQGPQSRTAFHGAGRAGDVETTALAALALIRSRQHPDAARAALAWLIAQKDGSGVWPSTQATVLALKALLAGTGQALGDGVRRLELALDDGKAHTVEIGADQAEVVKLIDLTAELKAGSHTLRLRPLAATSVTYQVVFRYHQPGAEQQSQQPLSITMEYEDRKLQIGDTLKATATLTNRMPESAPMVMVELPIPAGFRVEVTDFDRLVETAAIAKYQVQPTRVLIYLRELSAGNPQALSYRLHAQLAADIHVPAARVYEYYNSQRQAFSQVQRLVVRSSEKPR